MTDRKTCGTCGPDGGRCEWYYRNPPLCWRCKNKREWDTGECGQHAAYRKQRERVVELEASLRTAQTWLIDYEDTQGPAAQALVCIDEALKEPIHD